MHIDSISLTHVRIPLLEPFRISSGEVAEKDAIVVRLVSGGLVGYGESSPMAGSFYSPDTPDSCWTALTERLVPLALGREVSSASEMNALLEPVPGQPFAKAGIETAYWDLKGKIEGVPLCRLLGGERRAVPCGLALGLYDTIPQLLDAIARRLPEGYRRVKIKIQRGQDVGWVGAVREAYPDLPLQVDANGDYAADDMPMLTQLDRFRLEMIEQPFAAGALDGHARLQRSIRTPVCLDESAADDVTVEAAIGRGCCRVVNIKIQRVGGLWNALRMHDVCAAHDVPVWVGTMPELGIGAAQALALATLPGVRFPTDVEPSRRWFADDLIEPLIEMGKDGTIEIPEGPGIGYAVSEARVARYRVREAEYPASSAYRRAPKIP